MEQKVIGVAGTAKNTGKTTTINELLKEVFNRKLISGVTSIGYDGERSDNITQLSKPRIYFKKNSFVASTKKCLKVSKAEVEIIKETNITNPLGRVVIGKIIKEGSVVLAGPNNSNDLKLIIDYFKKYDCDLIFIDGALNRLSPMIVADEIILATGAAKDKNINQLLHESKIIDKIFNLPEVFLPKNIDKSQKIICFQSDKEKDELVNKEFEHGSLLLEEVSLDILEQFKNGLNSCYIPGAISIKILNRLFSNKDINWNKKTVIFHDPLRILIGFQLEKHGERLCKNITRGIMGVNEQVILRAIIINPFYPKYRVKQKSYVSSFIDADKLKHMMENNLDTEIINVKKEGVKKILDI